MYPVSRPSLSKQQFTLGIPHEGRKRPRLFETLRVSENCLDSCSNASFRGSPGPRLFLVLC